jgi:ribosomal protein S4
MRIIKFENRAKYKYYKRDFVFNYRRKKYFRRKKRFKPRFIQRRYLKHFYLVLTYKNFRRYMNLANRKVGYYYGNYFSLLEGRIFMMAYRSTFITNIFLIRYVIDKGLFTINGKIRRHYNYSLRPGDLFQVSFDYINFFYEDLLLRLEKNNIFFKVPNYLFANFNFMFVFF